MNRLRRHRRLLMLGVPLAVFVAAGILAPWITSTDPTATDLSASLLAPSRRYLLGTDELGRDQAVRLLYAARVSLTLTAAIIAISLTVGVVVGTVAGYVGGIADRLLLRMVDLALSMPTLVLALAILGIRGGGAGNLVLALSVFSWAPYARIARGAVVALRDAPPIDAARVLGARPVRILRRHVGPIALRPCVVFASTDVGTVVLATATLSFLGVGIDPPTPEWGQMLVESRPFLGSALWLAIPPGLAITAVVLSSNLISEYFATADVPSRTRRRKRQHDADRSAANPSPSSSPAAVGPATLVRVDVARADAGRPALIRVADLAVSFETPTGSMTVLSGLSYELSAGETIALVGESGSGKSVSVLGPLGLLPASANVTGSFTLAGVELVGMSDRELRRVRGRRIGVVFQDPFAALNPVRTVGSQLSEAVRYGASETSTRSVVRNTGVNLLGMVGLDAPDAVFDRYPHELSGGMRQRALIAIALAGEPDVLVADEPTTALDATVQARLITLLRELGDELGMAMIFIGHDLAVVAEVADSIMVMYDGQPMEHALTDTILSSASHPYTHGLLDAVPRFGEPPGTRFRTMPEPRPGGAALSGCRFAPRCGFSESECESKRPSLIGNSGEPLHRTACIVMPFVERDVVAVGPPRIEKEA